MGAGRDAYEEPLARAHELALDWLGSLDTRRIAPSVDADAVRAAIDGPLADSGMTPAAVVDQLVAAAEPGLMAMPSGRFFGWVIGGGLPAALAADWLVSAWDQNAALRYATPAAAAIEETASGWLLDLLGLPAGSDVGFVTGATMANFTALAAARHRVLEEVGWDVNRLGLTGAPRVQVLVGRERHDTVDIALRYLGLGEPTPVAADDQGRLRADALAQALDAVPEDEPVIVCLQAGNLHSGAFDPFAEAIAVAHARRAWVHVDGAFGLWALASPRFAALTTGLADADSWASDAHKTLNVPYDCGVVIVRNPAAVRSTFGVHASYLVHDAVGPGDMNEKVPELSRRARGIPVWAALRSLGRSGVRELVERLADRATALAVGVADLDGVEVLNDVVFTQVCFAFPDDARTAEVGARLIEDGSVWISGSRWRDRAVLRISVSNWSTDEADVAHTLETLRRAAV